MMIVAKCKIISRCPHLSPLQFRFLEFLSVFGHCQCVDHVLYVAAEEPCKSWVVYPIRWSVTLPCGKLYVRIFALRSPVETSERLRLEMSSTYF